MMVLTGACLESCADVFPPLLIENLKRAIRNQAGADQDFQIEWNEDVGEFGVWLSAIQTTERDFDEELIGTGTTQLEAFAAAYEQLRAWGS